MLEIQHEARAISDAEGHDPNDARLAELRTLLLEGDAQLKIERHEYHRLVKAYEEIVELEKLQEMVNGFIGKVTKYRPLVKQIIDEHREEVAGCLKDMVNIALDLYEDMKLERLRALKLKAIALWEYYGALKEAGFKTNEAMQIILSQGNGSGLTSLFTKAGEAFGQGLGKSSRG